MKAVSFELAKRLKALGYHEDVMDFYYKGVLNGNDGPGDACLGHNLFDDFNADNGKESENYCSAPFLEDVGEWLRTNHKLWVYVRPSFYDGVEYVPNLVDENGDEHFCDSEFFTDYNDAYERSIDEALDLINERRS